MAIIDFEEKKKKRYFPEIKEGECPVQERDRLEQLRGCQHVRVWIDESKQELECKDCGEKINPIWYIIQQTKMEHNLWRRREEIIDANEKLTKKITNQSRVKCKHCGKLTPIFENVFFKERTGEKK